MNCMATLKHIASKNSAYTAIEAYLVYQHDAFTGKQLLDEHGRPMLRESYILDTLECGDFSFATACLLANRKYNKNNHPDDIKSHQYIISFDPRDAADNGLTMEKAQALGLNFCKENFPGHPAIVCTHPDGHNHSGNIHVHIVIGSVRTREVERKPYMQKPRDWREGIKHSSTAQTMRHLRVEVMELCEGVGLYQIDLLNGSKERVSEAEYWARRRGQLKLDRENAALTAAGQQPRQKKFETVKDTLRKQISSVLYRSTSYKDFSDRLLQQYGIAVKESRGQLSYLPAGRTKFIRAKHLGDKFDANLIDSSKTCDRIAAENGVSKDTVIRASKYMRGVEIAEELMPGLKQSILSGQTKVSKADMHRLAKAAYYDRAQILQDILHPELKVEPTPDADGVIRVPGKAPVMPFRKFESVYDSDAYPEDVRYEYVALEELTTRFRISFNYQLEQMPDNAQRDVILEIINIPAIRILWNWANKATIQASCWMAQWKSFCMMKMAIRSASAGWQVGRFSGPNWPVPAGVPVRSACGPTQTVRCSGWISVRSCPSRP